MTYPQRHITAGDITPLTYIPENTYGTPSASAPAYYADIAEGGRFTPMDSANPYIAYRYGDRSYDPADYVLQQKDAGFSAVLEVRDTGGWSRIIENAAGVGGTTPLGKLPSRCEQINVYRSSGEWQGLQYVGCKTDSLTVSADAPGGIVKFEETVLASYSGDYDISTALAWPTSGSAVQWMDGMTVGGTQIYPQAFSFTINNGLQRAYQYQSTGAITGALLEGRREITLEAEVWMEDLTNLRASMTVNNPGNIVLILGKTNRYRLTFSGVRWMADSTHSDLIQDKQREKLRFRASAILIETVTPA